MEIDSTKEHRRAHHPQKVELTPDKFDKDEVLSRLSPINSGALVCFVGIVREFSDGRQIRRIRRMEFEADTPLAEQGLVSLREDFITKFKLDDMVIVHRIGALEVGEEISCVATLSERRTEGFRACEQCINEIKKGVIIHSKEILVEGQDD
ncbi:MAG: molybdenum cofactor biosynthesis protein MoaE [Methermicoccaceae archaeon]